MKSSKLVEILRFTLKWICFQSPGFLLEAVLLAGGDKHTLVLNFKRIEDHRDLSRELAIWSCLGRKKKKFLSSWHLRNKNIFNIFTSNDGLASSFYRKCFACKRIKLSFF